MQGQNSTAKIINTHVQATFKYLYIPIGFMLILINPYIFFFVETTIWSFFLNFIGFDHIDNSQVEKNCNNRKLPQTPTLPYFIFLLELDQYLNV